jgi:hypothetical protein
MRFVQDEMGRSSGHVVEKRIRDLWLVQLPPWLSSNALISSGNALRLSRLNVSLDTGWYLLFSVSDKQIGGCTVPDQSREIDSTKRKPANIGRPADYGA